MSLLGLGDPRLVPLAIANEAIGSIGHYLGPSQRGAYAWLDDFGVVVLANPSSRRLPQRRWVELVRWCLRGVRNGGSQQWRDVAKWLRANVPHVTTVVSYSDPSAGHTGALYRASGWLWAPTWHRLRPPPTGNGAWSEDDAQAVKDRWVFPLRPDADRVELLTLNDESILRAHPELRFDDRHGVPYRLLSLLTK